MEEFIRTRGLKKLPARAARGAYPFKPTAYASSREEVEWLVSHKPTEKCNEENLAKAKILTMIEDLSGKGRAAANERIKLQNDAYRWFFRPSDFEDWCDVAGFDPDYVREQAQKVHENGLPEHRAAPGTGKRYEERRKYRQKTGRQRFDS